MTCRQGLAIRWRRDAIVGEQRSRRKTAVGNKQLLSGGCGSRSKEYLQRSSMSLPTSPPPKPNPRFHHRRNKPAVRTVVVPASSSSCIAGRPSCLCQASGFVGVLETDFAAERRAARLARRRGRAHTRGS